MSILFSQYPPETDADRGQKHQGEQHKLGDTVPVVEIIRLDNSEKPESVNQSQNQQSSYCLKQEEVQKEYYYLIICP